MVYFNPRGHNWGPTNLDGYGITYVVFTMLYSIIFYAACTYLWVQRNHPVVKMRKMNLALLSLLVLHVYVVLVLLAYTINGAYPCDVEFWIMSIYLPIGIGLFQAQNQQLLIVSREQNQLVRSDELYKPLFPNQGRGIGGPNYWAWRFKLWWRSVSAQNKYEGFVFVGIVIQVSWSVDKLSSNQCPN